MSPKRRILLAILATLLVLGLGVLMYLREQEPSYEGRALSEWLSVYATNMPEGSGIREREKAEQAVRAIGTNAVPVLLRWMDPHPDFAAYAALVGRRKLRADLALVGFKILGAEARQAVAELSRWMKAGDVRATVALGWIGEHGLAELLAVASDHQSTNRRLAILVIANSRSLGTYTNRTLTVLMDAVTDSDGAVREAAKNALNAFAPEALTARIGKPVVGGSTHH
jgi:hypothetical protein